MTDVLFRSVNDMETWIESWIASKVSSEQVHCSALTGWTKTFVIVFLCTNVGTKTVVSCDVILASVHSAMCDIGGTELMMHKGVNGIDELCLN